MVCEDASVGVEFPKPGDADPPVEMRRRVWPQHTAALLATLLAMSGGIVMGWSTPAVPYLQEPLPLNDGTNGTTVPITDEEGSWLGSLSAIGALVGAAPAGFLSDLMGRKRMLLIFSVPLIASWIMIILVERNVVLLYVARFISGIGLGGATVISPVYNEEIADVEIRGALGTYCEIMLCVGIFYAYCVGSYLPYVWFQVASCGVPILFLLSFSWMPESPVYLVQKGRDKEAEKALGWLKGARREDAVIQEEMESIRAFVNDSQPSKGDKRKADLQRMARKVLTGISKSSPTFKAAYIVYGLMVMQQMCGTCAINYYMVNVFRDAGSTLSPYVCSIIVAFVQLASGFVASRVVDRLGRKPMLLFSSTSLAVCLTAMATYTHFKHVGADVSSYTWVPLVALNLFVVMFEFGVGPLPWLMMAELAPSKSRAFISGSSVCFNWVLVFVVTKCFTNMIEGIGLAMTYGCYAIFMCVGFFFVWFLVPETKGKTRETIQHELKYGQKSTL